jgi:hypothetical protein
MGLFRFQNGFFMIITIFKINPIGQWGKILVTVMGFAQAFGLWVSTQGV